MKKFTLFIAIFLLINLGLFAQSGLTIQGGGAVTVNGDFNIIPNSFFIGQSYGGGIIFYVTPDGQHGLIAEIQDQSSESSWYDAQDNISNPNNHSLTGKNYTDWRFPTKYELNLLYINKSVVGGFAPYYYWSSTEYYANNTAYNQNFVNGNQGHGDPKTNPLAIRAIRSF